MRLQSFPLVGDQQGLAVYLNGTRFNSSFGDTTNFDLIPNIAINRIEITGYGASLQATYKSEILGHANCLMVGASTTFFASSALGGLTLDRGFAGPGTVLEQADGSIAPVRVSAQNHYYGIYAQGAVDLTSALTFIRLDRRYHRPPQQRPHLAG